jgi:hypothetical protein
MSDANFMVCMRITDAKVGEVAEGSVISNCSKCDAPIWISKASQDQLVEVNATPICTRCFKPEPDAEFIPPTKGVIEEIIKHITNETNDQRNQGGN